MELQAVSVTLQPARWRAGSTNFGTDERLAELLFDRLVSLDNYGRFQPQLATEWRHDEAAKHWQFTLRPGVKFSDGAPLTANDVVAALQPLLPRRMQIVASTTGVAIHCASPASDLLELLASGPYFVYKDDGGMLLGTGPFVLETAAAAQDGSGKRNDGGPPTQAQRLRFRYNDNCWSGRPYVDAVEVTLGVPPLRVLLDLQLGKTDLGELSVDTVKRAQQLGLKSWASAPLTLYALRFSGDSKSDEEQHFRESVGLAVDREAMARVLLQKQAEPAGAFLPQWLSGYAFLFETESNLERAKQLRAKLGAKTIGVTQPLRVGADATNELAKLIAERVVVNARAAGLTLQTVKESARGASDGPGTKVDADAQLIAWRYSSLSPRDGLERLAEALQWQLPEGGVPGEADARYAWEKRMMDERNLLPIVGVPDYAGVDARVRNWSPAPWGEWRLADVWLERSESSTGTRDTMPKPLRGARP